MWKSKTIGIFYLLSFLLSFLLITVSCKTKKTGKTAKEKEALHELEFTTFSVPKATFTFAQKQNSIDVNGSIRIKNDSIIILSFQPFLGVEVGRASITQRSLTIVDRINKRYFSIDFDSLRATTNANIDYYALQSIFTNSLFIYNDSGRVSISDFEAVQVGELSLLQASKKGAIQEFNVNEEKRVLSGRVFANNEPYSISWNYLNFMSLENGYFFPHTVKIAMSDGNNRFGLDLAYSKVELNKNINFQFSVPSSYSRVSLEELLKIFQ